MRTPLARPPRHLAAFISPMKALGVAQVPDGRWQCEIKFDGFRAIAVLNRRRAELMSRTQHSLSADFPEVVTALQGLNCRNAVLDGEIVALDKRGRSSFQLLQQRELAGGHAPIIYYVFDLLHADGISLLQLPLVERRRRLEVLLRKARPPVQLSAAFAVAPSALLAEARKQGLEGIIAKKPESSYEAGRRTGSWVKCKLLAEQEFVIGGFTLPQNSRPSFGAILVGYYEQGQLLYAGKVGSGFNSGLLRSLHAQFLERTTEVPPFANLPMGRKPRFGLGMTQHAMKQVTWIKPNLVAQIRFAEWTADNLLRQPVFLGLRKDKAARQVRREAAPVAAEAAPKKLIRTSANRPN